MRLVSILVLIPVLLLLAACAPIYQTTNSYVAPKGKSGKMCAMQCQQSQMLCQQLCSAQTDNCKNTAQQQALFSYEEYKSEQIQQGKPVNKTVSDFYNDWQCSNLSCSCSSNYDNCFTACGGQVIPHTRCVAFCDKK